MLITKCMNFKEMKSLLTILFTLIISQTQGQEYVWARNYVQSESRKGVISSFASDTSGNIFITGNFDGIASINDSNVIASGFPLNSPIFNHDFFISKVNPLAKTEWVRIYGNNENEQVIAIETDKQGNLFIIGENSDGSSIGQTSFSEYGCFLMKMNQNGNPLWTLKLSSGSNYVSLSNLKVVNDEVYISGKYEKNLDVGNINLSTGANANYSVFIAKINRITGQVIWARNTPPVAINDMAPIDNGELLIAGYIDKTTNFGNYTISNVGFSDAFVAKLNSNGIFEWVKQYGSTGHDKSMGITVDNLNNVYLAGTYSSDCLLAKLDQSGNEIWVKYIPSRTFHEVYFENNSLYIIGHGTSLEFVDTTLSINTYANNNYILKLDTSGVLDWVIPNDFNSSTVEELAFGKNGGIYSYGRFALGRNLNLGASHLVVSPNDGFNYYVSLIFDDFNYQHGMASIEGKTYFDTNNNCVFDSTDTPAYKFGVVATPGNFLGVANEQGEYNIKVPEGDYTVQQILPEEEAGAIQQTCPNTLLYNTGFLNSGAVLGGLDFGNYGEDCLYTWIKFENSFEVVCGRSHEIRLLACNNSRTKLDSATIRINLPDSLILISTSPSYSYIDTMNDELVFENIAIPSDTCQYVISIVDSFYCTSQARDYWGLVFTYSASLNPKNTCIQSDTSFNKAIGESGFIIPVNINSVEKQELEIEVLPNPFDNFIKVKKSSNKNEKIQYNIWDSFGRNILSINETSISETKIIDLDFLSRGIYILNVNVEGKIFSKKIVKLN